MSAREPGAGTFVGRTLTVLGLAALAAGAALVLWSGRHIFLLAFVGVLVAVFLHAPARFVMARTGLAYGRALAAHLAVLVVLAGGGLWLLGPSVGAQVLELAEQLPGAVDRALEAFGSQPVGAWVLERLAGEAEAAPAGSSMLARVAGTAAVLGDTATKAVFVLFLGLFLAAAPRRYRDGLVRLLPASRRPKGREALAAAHRAMQGWLVGLLAAMAFVGLVTWLGLSLIGVPLALALAIVAALAEAVPIFGPLAGFVLAALLALSVSWTHLLWVVGLFLTIQVVQGNLVVPLVQQRTVDLPPALTITAVFVAGAVFGPLGLLVATPLLAVVMALVKLLYVRDVLGDSVEVAGVDGTQGGRRRARPR